MLGVDASITVIDLTHELPPHDVRAGALALLRAVQYLPEGTVVLAVVDPGVGTDRRLLAVECEAATFVGPDNGLLAPAVAMLGGARRVVELSDEEHRLPAPGPTFAGRDVLAPAAAALATGTPLDGSRPDRRPGRPRAGARRAAAVTDEGAIEAEVWWIDRFGNAQLNVGPEELTGQGVAPGGVVEVRAGERSKSARWVHTYADARPSELVLLVDSYGLLALALDRRSAAAEYGLRPGGSVTLVPPGAS